MTRDERRNALENERLRLQAEINSYPMPIPACDIYFNDLLERPGVALRLALLQPRPHGRADQPYSIFIATIARPSASVIPFHKMIGVSRSRMP